MPPAGILQTEMDEETQLEIEIQQDLERIDLDNDNFVDDGQDAEISNEILDVDPAALEDAADGVDGEVVPAELQDYLNTIQKQRIKFEEELEECDTLLDSAIASVQGKHDPEKNGIANAEWQALEEVAAQEGMTVEEYRKKLLQDIEDEPFELEEMDFITDDSEFVLPHTNIEEVLQALDKEAESNNALMLTEHSWKNEYSTSEDQEMVEKALTLAFRLQSEEDRKSAKQKEGALAAVKEEGEDGLQLVPVDQQAERNEESEDVLAITNGEGGTEDGVDTQLVPVRTSADSRETVEEDQTHNQIQEHSGSETNGNIQGTVALVHNNPLLEFEQYLREQFQLAEEQFRQREKQLQQELEARREVEEQLMLALEEQKLKAVQEMRQEEENLARQKEESRKKLDIEIETRQKVLEADLQNHEKTIATLTAQLEEDRYQLEKLERAESERLAQKRDKAATLIQRCYKGYSVRKQHESERKTLDEKREQRKEEKWQQRVEEVDREIQQRKEEEKRKEEEARLAKEEEERKAAEEKRKVDEEKQKKKEEEERKKKEAQEKKRQEEEEKKRLKEEQKRLKEEEKRRKKEEEEEKKRLEEEEKKRKKEEERKRKEEEEEQKRLEAERKRQEEEERKQKEEEEKKRKEEEEKQRAEEEERKKEEEKKRLEEEERKRKEEEEKKAKEEAEERERKEKEEKDKPRAEENELPHKEDTNSVNNNNPAKVVNNNLNDADMQPQSSVDDSPVVIDLEPVSANNLPKQLEERRLSWMKQCLPWSKVSNEPWKLKSEKERSHRRPASAKKLPTLPDKVILEAAHVASLRQVTTVELQDLPGYALTPFGNCISLTHLKMTHCRLITLDNLSQCKHLQCIDVQDNLIEFVDLKELSSLYTLNLSHNKLSSVHGLAGCTNLRLLDVSHNRLTKLLGLTPLRRLHTLQASSNQIVTTSGLEQCPTIQQLDLSANYLTSVEGLSKLALLTSLNVASNNLTQMPTLENSVLLQELVLRENSIGPELDLSVAWLPLLSYLDLSQNVIEELKGSADGLFVLKRLDLAVNQITDVSSFLPAMSGCPRLEDLSLLGNAVLDEDNFREKVKKAIQCLVSLNGESLRTQAAALSSARPVRGFEMLCLTQVQLHKDIKLTFEKERRSSLAHAYVSTKHACDIYFKFCDKSFKMAVEHRYAHEYGELSTMPVPTAPQIPRSARPNSGRSPKIPANARSSVLNSSQALTQEDHETLEKFLSVSDDLFGSSSPAEALEEKKLHSPKLVRKNVAVSVQTKIVAQEDKPSPAPALSAKEKFEMALRGETVQENNSALQPDSSHHTQSSAAAGSVTGATGLNQVEGAGESDYSGETGVRNPGFGGGAGRRGFSPEDSQPQMPQLSQKEKFERALAGLPPNPSPLPPVGATSLHIANGQSDVHNMRSDDMQIRQVQGLKGITADVVGDIMREGNIPGDEFDFDLDNLEEMMEGLQFDIDGFLDLDQFDFDEDFLEKGWRPEDTPQIPQKIHSSASIGSNKPPLPPVPPGGLNRLPHGGLGQHHHHPLDPPGPPPGRPGQAWNMGPESVCSDGPPKVPPLRPPSSVASGEDSQAITTGRSRREDKLAEEWGFKDKATAEMMMQRAKKMKYNAERRKKLSKLDPQQRLRLFRKLEEVRGITTIRPPPPRVLPRKEYFQAREEEAHQREVEKHLEYRTRAGRTFEWIHTQVGDYNVSSSRINPGPQGGDSSLVKTTSDTQLSHYASPSPHGHSPNSLEEYQGYASGQRYPVAKRHSVSGEELVMTGQATMFPPIKTNSASSQQSRNREKMSWRTEEVDKSVGWGGGKKRSVRK